MDLANTIPVPNQNTSFHGYMPKKNECNLFLSPVLEEDIISTVNACKSKTSCDQNNIDMVIVKQVINYIAKPLAHVCSKSFECGVFPDNMKVVNIFTVCESNCLFNMRKKKDFVQKYTRTDIKAMSVSVIDAKLWNELDSDLRHIKNILLFKKKLKWGILPTYVSHVT